MAEAVLQARREFLLCAGGGKGFGRGSGNDTAREVFRVLASKGLRGVQCSRCRSFPGGSVDVVSFDFVICKVEYYSEFQT